MADNTSASLSNSDTCLANSDTRLGTLSPGTRGIIKQIGSSNSATDISEQADRLREIGFAEGLDFEIMQQSPFGRDPIAVSVGGMTVALRRHDANLIFVETL